MANLLLSAQGFLFEDFTQLPLHAPKLNEAIISARKDGDAIFGNLTIGEINTTLGFTLNELAWKPLEEIKTVIPLFTNDIQKFILKLLSFADSALGSRTLEDLHIEFEQGHNGLLGMIFNPSVNADVEIFSQKTWLQFHRVYFVRHVPQRQDFSKSISRYFPRLIFSEPAISAGLANLTGTTYDEIVRTILHHLSALNDDYCELFDQHRHQGADTVCSLLEQRFANNSVVIGASRDQNNITELNFEFQDDKGNSRTFNCNLHTKFAGYFEHGNPNHGLKSNRIYFHQPTDDFQKGQVLIGRIGRHRETGFH